MKNFAIIKVYGINYETVEVALEERISYENRRKKQLGRPSKNYHIISN